MAVRRGVDVHLSGVCGLVCLVAQLSGTRVWAQDEPRRCIEAETVSVCGLDVDASRSAALASRLVEIGAPSESLRIEVDAWTAVAIELRVVSAEGERALRVPVADLPPEPAGLDVRARTVAMVLLAQVSVAAPTPWIDERPASTEEDRKRFYPTLYQAPRPGLSSITLRVRGLGMVDRTGAAFDGELSVEHLLDDVVTLGVEIAPVWFAVGEGIRGGLTGGMATGHLLFDGDVVAIGVYGGVAALPRLGTPWVAIAGLRLRIGLYDLIHAEVLGSVAYNDTLGILFGDLRLELLFPIVESVEMLVRPHIAFELGWLGAEVGARFWPSGREAGSFGVEVAVGGRSHVFLQRCELGGCSPEWGAGGPTVSVAWITRLR